ncbi:MAG: NAD-dependent epimerase/dehydratase family protein [Clostridia bacterium]|nr:NAD-dependent epimerase/dehydratase family protein [Clostridia bacterium]
MKRILIAGANSYIGESFERYMQAYAQYQVDTVDVIGDAWKNYDFSLYDAVFCVAGIAHQKETTENAALYYQVNRDLAVELAKKAKQSGVDQFVFMSSMSVYGMDEGIITPDTKPVPVSHYGKSKLQAEELLQGLGDDSFKVAMLRPPMVYGKACRGNFTLLLKLVQKSPVFPAMQNERSMIYVENLCAFVRMVIDRQLQGVFCPQNSAYMNTTHMARVMASALGKKVWFSRLAGLAVRCVMPFYSKAKKAFSTLIYQDMEQFSFCYCTEDMDSSIRKSL